MNNSLNYALYYPTIEFNDYGSLWSAALLWDKIYRIVPKSYIPDDPKNVQILMQDGSIGSAIHPDEYARDTAKKFLHDLKTKGWDASALTVSDPEKIDYVRLHKDKVDVMLKEMIISKSQETSVGDWFNVPSDFGGLYMTYLAKEVSERNNLQLISDFPAAWTGTTYFRYDGKIDPDVFSDAEMTHRLANIIISNFVPENILSIPPEEIIRFRKERKHERQRFVLSIKQAATKFANCEDPKIIRDLIEDVKKDIANSIHEYKKSADILNVTGWAGFSSLSFPILSNIILTIIPLDDPVKIKILSTMGLAIGLIASIAKLQQKQQKLSRESDYSYLLHSCSELRHYDDALGYNTSLWRNIEEFVND